MAVKLIIDSGCDLMKEQLKELDVQLVPMTVRFGQEEYQSGVTITNEEFYQKLASAAELPTTSQPTPHDFEQAYREATQNGDTAVVLCISSALSGTYQSAMIAAQEMAGQVFVVDTRTVTIGERILLEYAIALRDQGYDAAEIAAKLEHKKEQVSVIGAVDTLEYLIKGGRMSKAAGAVGSMLGIRPILKIQDGVLAVAGKARGAKAGITMMKKLVEEARPDPKLPCLIGYTGTDPTIITPAIEMLKEILPDAEFSVGKIGSAIGTHAGPGLIGISFFQKS